MHIDSYWIDHADYEYEEIICISFEIKKLKVILLFY